jgi:hypothetical protein
MTAGQWVTRAVCALLALALFLASLLTVVEIAAAALDRAPVLVPHAEQASWLRAHRWDEGIVRAVLAGLVVLGLSCLFLALRRGKPAALPLSGRTDGVDVTASRRSVEQTLAAAAARTTGISGANASVSRRTARVDARTVTRSASGVRDEVEAAVRGRLDSLGLERRVRTRIDLAAEDAR